MINFLRYRYACLAASIALMVVGAVFYGVNYRKTGSGFRYHIDFVGGTELTVQFSAPIKTSMLRDSMSGHKWKDLVIQSVGLADSQGKYKEFIVRLGETEDGVDVHFKADLEEVFPDNYSEIRGVSRVGAEVGKDISWNSFLAVMLSLLIILLYVAIRSKYRFAVGAVVALAHDMLGVLVVFLIFQEQISVSVLAAVLAVLGYSINDTIVIFSRVRENMIKLKGRSEVEIVNTSINQTLRRTLLTSVSTLLTILSILFLGGEVLHGFALAMLVGVIFGTYSSIYVASPVMLALGSSKS